MATIKSKSYDRNRFKKVYPRFRPAPNKGLFVDGNVVLEALKINFSNQDSVSFSLANKYAAIPSVTITPVGDINNVNVWISAISISSVPSGGGRTVNITVAASAKFTGTIQLQAIQV